MSDRQLGYMWSWRESEWETAFFKRLILLATQNRPDGRDGDRTPVEFIEGVTYYQQCMYLAHRTAALTVASTVEYVEATAQLVHDARCDGPGTLAADLEQCRRRAIGEALTVSTAAVVHAADLKAIQRFGTAMLARGNAALRVKHARGSSLTYTVPAIAIPRDLYEIGQTRVESALTELVSDLIVGAAPQSQRRSPLRSAMPRSA
ncbi:MAG TPA: hypothetical protein VEX15_22690 [Nocardioidaceae bacterium]|nr:hypothetical protein [Nocardioidaceae bacterium]